MLAAVRTMPQGQVAQVWFSDKSHQVLAATYVEAGSMATYYLVSPDEYTKSMLDIVNSPPPPPAPPGK